MQEKVMIRDCSTLPANPVAFSFCTLVTRMQEYRDMVDAFVANGFTEADCEFLYVDNSVENRFDAFAAYNRFLLEAKGRYVVLCHQDILPNGRHRAHLESMLADLTRLDPNWAVCGNAGGTESGDYAMHISHPGGEDLDFGGPAPVRVMSLDENFILVRREANLALSHDLSGFHWYGSDLCIMADILGWHCYAIDFNVLHKSRGNVNDDFKERGRQLRRKYSRAFRPRWQHVVTHQPVYISSSPIRTFFFRALNSARVRAIDFWRKSLMRSAG